MMTVLKQNCKAQNKLEEQLKTLKQEQEAKDARISRVSAEVRNELVRMKAFGEMYREYSLANLTTKRKLSKRERSRIARENTKVGARPVPSIIGPIKETPTEANDKNLIQDSGQKAGAGENGDQFADENNEIDKDETGESDELANAIFNKENKTPALPVTGPFALYRGPNYRSSHYLKSPSKTFIRTPGVFTFNRGQTELTENKDTDKEKPAAKKVSVMVKKLRNRNIPGVGALGEETGKLTTHITNFYGFHTVTEDAEKDAEVKPTSLDLTRETTAMFAKRRGNLLPPNVKTAYAFRKFMEQKTAEVMKDSTPTKVRQKKTQNLVPFVKFPEIIQKDRSLSAIIHDHQQYREVRQPSPQGTYSRLARWRLPALHRKYGSSPEFKPTKEKIQSSDNSGEPPLKSEKSAKKPLESSKIKQKTAIDESDPLDECPPHLKVDEAGDISVDNIFDTDIKTTKENRMSHTHVAYKVLITEKPTKLKEFKTHARHLLEKVEEAA